MPDPVSEASQPAFAFAPLRRGRFDERRSSRAAVPGFRRRPGPPSSPSVGSKRTQAPDPPRLALARKDKPSGNDRLRGPPVRGKPRSAFPQGYVPIERRTSQSRRTLFAALEPKRTPILLPPDPRREASSPSRPVRSLEPKQAPILPPPDLRTRSKLLVLDPSRHSRGANSVPLPPDLSPRSELLDTGPFAASRQGEPCIFRRRIDRSRASSRTSILRSLEPEQAPSSTAGPQRIEIPSQPVFANLR
jgi:hypothetical protein